LPRSRSPSRGEDLFFFISDRLSSHSTSQSHTSTAPKSAARSVLLQGRKRGGGGGVAQSLCRQAFKRCSYNYYTDGMHGWQSYLDLCTHHESVVCCGSHITQKVVFHHTADLELCDRNRVSLLCRSLGLLRAPIAHRGMGSEEGAAGTRGGDVGNCMSCRVIGTVVPTVASGYLAATLYTTKPPQGLHKVFTLVFVGGFAAMGVFRAVV